MTLREHLEAIRREAQHDDPSDHVAAALAILNSEDVVSRRAYEAQRLLLISYRERWLDAEKRLEALNRDPELFA